MQLKALSAAALEAVEVSHGLEPRALLAEADLPLRHLDLWRYQVIAADLVADIVGLLLLELPPAADHLAKRDRALRVPRDALRPTGGSSSGSRRRGGLTPSKSGRGGSTVSRVPQGGREEE